MPNLALVAHPQRSCIREEFKEQAVSAHHRTCVWLMTAGRHFRFRSSDAWWWRQRQSLCDVNFSNNASGFWKMPVDFVLGSQGEELFDLAQWIFHCFLQYRRRNNSLQKNNNSWNDHCQLLVSAVFKHRYQARILLWMHCSNIYGFFYLLFLNVWLLLSLPRKPIYSG